jgi:dihydroorotase
MASVGWWHLVADSGKLDPAAEGWRLVPSLGSPRDREALIAGLACGLITAVAVHHSPLDAEEQLLPLDQRRPGVAGHGAPRGLVLPQLWQELVARRGWTPAQLWQVLCWGGSQLLGETPERLEIGSRRWLLFDPEAPWTWQPHTSLSLAANQPLLGAALKGQIRATGLTEAEDWLL